jgi:hypothetical protein
LGHHDLIGRTPDEAIRIDHQAKVSHVARRGVIVGAGHGHHVRVGHSSREDGRQDRDQPGQSRALEPEALAPERHEHPGGIRDRRRIAVKIGRDVFGQGAAERGIEMDAVHRNSRGRHVEEPRLPVLHGGRRRDRVGPVERHPALIKRDDRIRIRGAEPDEPGFGRSDRIGAGRSVVGRPPDADRADAVLASQGAGFLHGAIGGEVA